MMVFMQAAHATTILQVHMDSMLKTAQLVFSGRVLSSEARWLEDGSTIKTFIVFDVQEIISGNYSEDELTLSFEGGTVAEDTIEISGMTMPKLGEKGIYFVENIDRPLVNPIVGWSQGHFLIKNNEAGEEIVLTQNELGVTKMELQSPTAQQNSNEINITGIADGITASKTTNTAMSAERFKQNLLLRLKQIKQ